MAKFAFDAVAGEPVSEVEREYRFSLYKSLADPAPQTVTLEDLRMLVSEGEFSDLITKLRGEPDEDRQKALKKMLPCVAISGEFSGGHHSEHFIQHSGLICIDFDADKNPNMAGCADEWRDKLVTDEFVRMAFVSARGNGVAAVCRIETERHSEAFDALQAYFKSRHGLIIDKSCRDVTRLRFLSWDPDVSENSHARIFKRYALAAKAPTTAPMTAKDATAYTLGKDRREEIMQALERVLPDDRQTWLDVGMAIQSEAPGLEGFNLWRIWSELNDCAGKFDEKDIERVWKSFGRRAGTNIETLFGMAYKTGWKGPQAARHVGGSLPVIAADVWLASKVLPRDPIIEGVIDAGAFCLLVGPSKCKKSFFALQLSTCVSTGMKFLAWPVSRPRKTLLVNVELLPDRAHDRESNMTRGLGIPSEDLSRLMVANIRGLDITDCIGAICATIREHRPELTVIDPIYLVTDEDESDPVAMKLMCKRLQATIKETSSAIIIVHHDAKGKAGDRDKRDRGSGSSVIGRFIDGSVILTPHKDDPENMICVESMYRYLPPQDGITCRLDDGRLVVVEDVTCEVETSKPQRVLKSDAVLDAAITAIIPDIIANGPYATSAIRAKMRDLGVTNNSKQSAGIKRLKDMTRLSGAKFAFAETGGGRASFGTLESLSEISIPRAYSDDF